MKKSTVSDAVLNRLTELFAEPGVHVSKATLCATIGVTYIAKADLAKHTAKEGEEANLAFLSVWHGLYKIALEERHKISVEPVFGEDAFASIHHRTKAASAMDRFAKRHLKATAQARRRFEAIDYQHLSNAEAAAARNAECRAEGVAAIISKSLRPSVFQKYATDPEAGEITDG